MSEAIGWPKPECAKALASMAQFVDGELPAAQSAWLAGHLDWCPECHAALAKLSELDGALIAWGQGLDQRNPAPADARERLEAGLGSLPAGRRSIAWIPAVAATIAAGLALVVVAPHQQALPAHPGRPRFVAIPYLPPLDPRENATVVRMSIRVASLIEAGYRITADPDSVVLADVLVGEDGRAHAVRLLSGIDSNEIGE